MGNWYLQQGDQRLGPMPLEQLQQMAAIGQVAVGDLVWGEGMPTWEPAGSQSWFPAPVGAPLSPQWSSIEPPPPAGPVFTSQPAYIGPPPSLLGWSIFVLLCCCIPGGIVGIVMNNQAQREHQRGDSVKAWATYKNAKTVLIVSACAGAVFSIIYAASKIHL